MREEERKGEEEKRRAREKGRRGEEEKVRGGGLWQYIKQYFRRNYRRKLIAVGAINFHR
jgi:hypothetical protein